MADLKHFPVIKKWAFYLKIFCIMLQRMLVVFLFLILIWIRLINIFNNPLFAFANSRNNYLKESETEDNLLHFFGKQALLKLKELFEMECIDLESVAPSKDRSMIIYLNWKIWNIKGRRKLLRHYLNENKSNIGEKGIKMISVWTILLLIGCYCTELYTEIILREI